MLKLIASASNVSYCRPPEGDTVSPYGNGKSDEVNGLGEKDRSYKRQTSIDMDIKDSVLANYEINTINKIFKKYLVFYER